MNLTSAIPGMDCSAGRRKGRVGRLIAAGIFAAALLGLLVLTLADLRRAASPIVFPVEDVVYNLTAEALVTTPEETVSVAVISAFSGSVVSVLSFPHAVNPSSITIARSTQISFFIFVFILLL